MISLKQRVFLPEKMDLPGADVPTLLRTVRQFASINRFFSRSDALLRDVVIAPNRGTKRTVTLVDVGGGGGDIMRAAARQCRRARIPCRITVLDNDRRILDQTRRACRGYEEIRVQEGEVGSLGERGPFDYVFSNHFLHHFPDPEIPDVLRSMYAAASRALIVNDLYRSAPALLGYTLFASLFLHRSFAAYDGRLSIRKGFRESEAAAFVETAGIPMAHISRRTPSRLIIIAPKASAQTDSGQEREP